MWRPVLIKHECAVEEVLEEGWEEFQQGVLRTPKMLAAPLRKQLEALGIVFPPLSKPAPVMSGRLRWDNDNDGEDRGHLCPLM